MSYIEMINYTKKIKRNKVIDNVSLNLEKGKIYKVVGTNGSGKTMLIRAIAGLMFPTTGELYVDGKLVEKNKDYPANVGVVIENPLFWNSYTGYEMLRYLADVRNIITKQDIIDSMERICLDYKDKRTISKYSLGMKKKLAICQSFMEKPDILLLDEPTNALDKNAIKALRKILIQEKERGGMILIATHDDGELSIDYDEVFEIYEGKIQK